MEFAISDELGVADSAIVNYLMYEISCLRMVLEHSASQSQLGHRAKCLPIADLLFASLRLVCEAAHASIQVVLKQRITGIGSIALCCNCKFAEWQGPCLQ